MANLAAAFVALPEEIKNWLSSQEVTGLIADINGDLKLAEDRVSVIPRLILRLAAQDLNPRDFANEISSQLGIVSEQAKETAERIYQDVLKPIEPSLKEAGVDVSLLMKPRGQTDGFTKPISSMEPAKPISPIAKPTPPSNLPMTAPPLKPAPSDGPLILHQEESVAGAPEKPSFKYRPPLWERPEREPAPKAEVEIPNQATKVVHYNSFLTPLNQASAFTKPAAEPRIIPIPKSKWFV